MTTEFAYFPGCASCSTGLSYEMSTQYLSKQIGLTLKEIPDWNCCGASAAHLINHDLGLALPARSLAITEEKLPGLDVVATCAACFARLKTTQHYVNQSPKNRSHIEGLIEREYRGEANVYGLVQVLHQNEDLKEALVANLKKTLGGLKVACYYGCMLVRPIEVVQFDDEENPQSMDDLMRLAGAEPVDWAFKTECCGASLQVTCPVTGKVMVEKILHNAQENGAEVIVTACPLCQLNLDMREKEVNRMAGTSYDLPVYYFTELLSMCLGASPKQLGIDKHYHPAVVCAESSLKDPVVPEAESDEEVLAS
ncbi:MAG: CoB--CoM heterodisulfide reductase iron-sulfur subunit B family protein [Coriobacteriia bacterium]|nr:CoB--CoM heterodisulfide reductase iron-sulfur subunit B family protein [Coriobacteriia bacterium]MCL2749793.1 CoB--CoM heterodisulfide reductase iron-sulfur subunit B family protein [Coriobacteriia bacterium]